MEGDGGDKGPMTDITANPDCLVVWGAGIAQWLERRTRD